MEKKKQKKTKSQMVIRQTKLKYQKAIKCEQDELYRVARTTFMDKFTLCDLTCKSILEASNRLKKKEDKDRHVVLDMRSIPAAFATFSIQIDRNILSRIFGGTKSFKNKGTKSAKKLRDGIIHAMNEDDIEEVYNRYQELMDVMDVFLSVFQ